MTAPSSESALAESTEPSESAKEPEAEPSTDLHAVREAGEAGDRGDDTTDQDELAALEALLAARARELTEQRAELVRARTLLRDAVARFEAQAGAAADQLAADLCRERDQAIARAIEAEAARAEIRFRLDEVLGHLAAAGAVPEALPGERLDVTCARLGGTVRGLLSALAESQEAREVAQARLMLAEQDLGDNRAVVRALERELAEAREQNELEALKARRLSEQYRGGLGGRDASALRGERDGLRARVFEAERAFAAAARASAEVRAALAGERAAREGAAARIAELEQAGARDARMRAELESELSRASAERLSLRDELARAHAELAQVRAAAKDAEAQRAGALKALSDELEAARGAAAGAELRADRQAAALREAREQLSALMAAVSSELSRVPAGRTAGEGAGDTHPGVPAYIETVSGLEVELAAAQERVRALEHRIATAAGAVRELMASPEHAAVAMQLTALAAMLERE